MVSSSYLMIFALLGFACGIGVGIEVNKKSNGSHNNKRK